MTRSVGNYFEMLQIFVNYFEPLQISEDHFEVLLVDKKHSDQKAKYRSEENEWSKRKMAESP